MSRFDTGVEPLCALNSPYYSESNSDLLMPVPADAMPLPKDKNFGTSLFSRNYTDGNYCVNPYGTISPGQNLKQMREQARLFEESNKLNCQMQTRGRTPEMMVYDLSTLVNNNDRANVMNKYNELVKYYRTTMGLNPKEAACAARFCYQEAVGCDLTSDISEKCSGSFSTGMRTLLGEGFNSSADMNAKIMGGNVNAPLSDRMGKIAGAATSGSMIGTLVGGPLGAAFGGVLGANAASIGMSFQDFRDFLNRKQQ